MIKNWWKNLHTPSFFIIWKLSVSFFLALQNTNFFFRLPRTILLDLQSLKLRGKPITREPFRGYLRKISRIIKTFVNKTVFLWNDVEKRENSKVTDKKMNVWMISIFQPLSHDENIFISSCRCKKLIKYVLIISVLMKKYFNIYKHNCT